MKRFSINAFRYTGSSHVTLAANQKTNPDLPGSLHITGPTEGTGLEEAFKKHIAENLSEGDDLVTAGDIEILVTDFPRKKLTGMATDKLLALYSKTTQMLGAKEMAEEILIKRGAVQPQGQEDPQEPVKGGQPEGQEEPQEPVKGDQPEEKPSPREYKKCMTEECLQARLASARENYRKICQFLCTKDHKTHYGLIRSARLDRRSGFIQYRIEILAQDAQGMHKPSGRVYGKGDDSRDLTIFEGTPSGMHFALI